ncbi:MAG: universal stress protein [Alphaproteobacteria bacterium]
MFKDILLPIDLGDVESSRKAVSTAIEMSRTEGVRLHVMCVVPGFSMSMVAQFFPEGFEEKSLAEAARKLDDFIAKNIPAEITSQAIVANGTVYEEILRTAGEIGCDLIVMTSHRPELKDYLLGPNAARVVRHAKCSVFVARG